MAKRRTLKKDIHYVAGELFAEVLIARLLIPGTDPQKADEVLDRILDMQDEYIRRAGTPDGKDNNALVREYYQKLRIDLQTEIDAIAGAISDLTKGKVGA